MCDGGHGDRAILAALSNLHTTLSTKLTSLDRKVSRIMALVQVEQTEVDTLARTLKDIGTNLADEIATLKAALPAADFSAVDAQVAALQALEVPVTPPAPPTP